jgi:hypothetical protein
LGVFNGEKKRKYVDAGDAKPLGAMIYFRLNEGASDISLTIADESGNDIITYHQDAMTLKFAGKNEFSYEAGLNRFVWDTRYPMITSIPGRPATNIRPHAKPGTYQARLTVNDVSQTQEFELHINPNESYTREQTDERFIFWMDLYQNVEESTQNVLAALKVKEDTAAKVQAMKDAGADAGALSAVEQQAAVISTLVDEYEATFVPTGRTLAEIINQPAKIFTKMIWLHNMMEVTEGPVTQSMKDVYTKLNQQRDAANLEFHNSIQDALSRFENISR